MSWKAPGCNAGVGGLIIGSCDTEKNPQGYMEAIFFWQICCILAGNIFVLGRFKAPNVFLKVFKDFSASLTFPSLEKNLLLTFRV